MMLFVILSFVILTGFILIGVSKFGLLNSYSDYSKKWIESTNMKYLHTWSIFTIIPAMLMIPPMIEVGESNAMQFLGFFAPLYLLIVGLTPEWKTNVSQHKIHTIFAELCALFAFAWVIFVCKDIFSIFVFSIIYLLCMLTTRSRRAYIFWGEMIMFSSVYASLISMLI